MVRAEFLEFGFLLLYSIFVWLFLSRTISVNRSFIASALESFKNISDSILITLLILVDLAVKVSNPVGMVIIHHDPDHPLGAALPEKLQNSVLKFMQEHLVIGIFYKLAFVGLDINVGLVLP